MGEEHLGGHHDASHCDRQAGYPKLYAHHDHFADLQIAGHRNHELPDLRKLEGMGGLDAGASSE